MTDTFCPRLIEVALPIREISAESVRDKSIRHGHISTLHLWWARRPLSACRAVIFASLVPDPDDPNCPSEFRDAVLRLLRDNIPQSLKGYWRGRDFMQDDPYKPYDVITDTPRNRLLTFIAKWSPEWIAFEKGESDRQPSPNQILDDRSLVKWDTSDPGNKQGQEVLRVARDLISIANNGKVPVLLDPFAGGGAIPLEATRLGCQAVANDYNPVAYLILRATCEFPQKHGGCNNNGANQLAQTERTTALKRDMSSLESSITVICRARQAGAAASFRDVRHEIEQEVIESVSRFWSYGFRGADLIVACYGPAVGVFGKYERVERADGTPVTVPALLEMAKESALKAIAGEFTGDTLSRLYFVWANLYGTSEQAWDDARLVIQIGGDTEDAMEVARRRNLFVVDGARCRLAMLKDRIGIRNLGVDISAPLIDQLHHAMQLWKEERRAELVSYLREHGLIDHTPFWKLAQALFEVLPRGEEDWKLASVLLGERETLRMESKRTEVSDQPELF